MRRIGRIEGTEPVVKLGSGIALNCDVLPLNIKRFAFPSEMSSGHLDIEPPEALWPETKGQAASLARVRGPSPASCGRSRGKFQGQLGIAVM